MRLTVKPPENSGSDYDYIAFSFNGLHSYEDFGIYRTSDSKGGFQKKLSGSIADKTANDGGSTGTHYLSTQVGQLTIPISFAFDDLTEVELQKLRKWLNGSGKMGTLWFAEAPHRVYLAKVTGKPEIKAFAFASPKGRVYKGTGTVEFTSYYPYACTPDAVVIDIDGEEVELPGNWHISYSRFNNYQAIQHLLPLESEKNGYGDMDFHFVAHLISPSSENSSILTVNTNGIGLELIGVSEAQIERTGDQLEGYKYAYDLEVQNGE